MGPDGTSVVSTMGQLYPAQAHRSHFLTGMAPHQGGASGSWPMSKQPTAVVARAGDGDSIGRCGVYLGWAPRFGGSQNRRSEMTCNVGHGQGGENDFLTSS